MPKGLDGPSTLVLEVIDEDPQSRHRFVLFNRRRDRMKSLVWDGSGYGLLSKRLEHGRFNIFDRASGSSASFELSSSNFA